MFFVAAATCPDKRTGVKTCSVALPQFDTWLGSSTATLQPHSACCWGETGQNWKWRAVNEGVSPLG